MNSYAGMRVFVSRPEMRTIARTWAERLFSWPWRPWLRTEQVVTGPAIPPDECYRIGNDLHCGELFYEKLKAATSASSSPMSGTET